MDHIEASCVVYVEVGTLHRLEQSKIYFLSVTELGIAMLTIQHLVSVSCNIHAMSWDNRQQTSFPSKNVLFYLTTPTFRRSFTMKYPCRHTHNIPPTWGKSPDGGNPVQPAAICSRIKHG